MISTLIAFEAGAEANVNVIAPLAPLTTSALTVAPLVGVDANAVQLAALSGGAAALVVVKEFAKKQVGPKPVKPSK